MNLRAASAAALLIGLVPALGLAQSGYEAPREVRLDLAPVSGEVRYRTAAGVPYVELRRRVPVEESVLVDARRGRVRVITQSGSVVTHGGMFDLRIDPDGVVALRLRGGDFRGVCRRRAAASVAPDAGRQRRVRRLWSNGHGRFRARGRWSAATVRGTKWLVEDRCDGTITEVARGEVEVEDFTVPEPTPTPTPTADSGSGTGPGAGAPAPAAAPERSGKPRRVRVRRGRRYVARAPR